MIVMHVKFLQFEVGGYSCHAMQLCTCMLFLSASVLDVNIIFQVLVKVFQGDPRLWQAYSHTLQVLSISFDFLQPFVPHAICCSGTKDILSCRELCYFTHSVFIYMLGM